MPAGLVALTAASLAAEAPRCQGGQHHDLSECARSCGGQVILFRTTASALLDPRMRLSVHRLSASLCVHLLVDISVCAGSACDSSWLSRQLDVPAWSYSAADIDARWPDADWPLLGHMSERLPAGSELAQNNRYLDCWLVKRLLGSVKSSARAPWPRGDGEGSAELRVSVGRREKLTYLVPYLIHEPSIVLWWENHRNLPDVSSVWVLEDDVIYAGNPVTFFERYVDR